MIDVRAQDRTFESLQIGEVCVREHSITHDAVAAFANISGDHNPLHTDPHYAAQTQFKNVVVHGMYLGALVSELVGMHLPGMHCLLVKESLEFKQPVFVDDVVRIEATIQHKSEVARILELGIKILRNDELVAQGSVHTKVL